MPNKPEYHSDSPKTAGPGRPTLASRASALLVTLLLLTIVTTIVVLMFQAVTIDRRLAADFQKGVQARTISQFALDDALQTLQSALNNLDDPFGATTAATNFWAVAPGRIDLFSLASGSSRPQRTTTIALHSGYDTSQELVDLNFTNASGTRAIWPGGLDMPVNWKPVLKNPSAAASAANPIVGRYAFWVDDESSKVNINTADGTELYTTNSYGVGTPSSVRLGAILTTLSTNDIKAISAAAIFNQFTDLSEVVRADTNSPPTNYLAAVRSNAFFLTEYSRSTEFNIFNEPRFQLASMWGGNSSPTNFIPSTAPGRLPLDFRISLYPVDNTIPRTNFPARSIYPAPLQLTNTNFSRFWPYMPINNPGFVYTDTTSANLNYLSGTIASISQITNNVGNTNNYLFGVGFGPTGSGTFNYNSPERFEAARRLALYLTGTNANNSTITWPFAQPNYTNKYSLSQLDSIIIQTLDRVNLVMNNDSSQKSLSFTIPPLLAPYGILGTNPVIGQGTSPKLCELLFDFSYVPKDVGVGYDDGAQIFAGYYRKAFAPGHYLNPATIRTNFPNSDNPNYGPCMFKEGSISGTLTTPNLNTYDSYPVNSVHQAYSTWPRSATNAGSAAVVPPFMAYPTFPAQTLAGTTYPGGGSYYPNPWVQNPAISTNTAPYGSQWGDTLLQAVDQNGLCAGLDFNLHPQSAPDPDPRAPYFRRGGNGTFQSANSITEFTNNGTTHYKWYGSIWGIDSSSRCSGGHAGHLETGAGKWSQRPGWYVTQNGWGMPRTTNSYSLRTRHTWNTSTTPPTRLITNTLSGFDANYTNPVTSVTFRGGVNYMANIFRGGGASLPIQGVMEVVPLSMVTAIPMLGANTIIKPGLPSTNSVIPFPASVTISATAPNQYVWAYVEDPMVNKFPGDWTVTRLTTMPSHTLGLPATSSTFDFKTNANTAANRDLASFWGPMSPNEYGVNSMLNLPSVGSLQYIRTKMMPDDSGPNTNRGVPFRCLSFAGVSDPTQSGIPDWAILDLMTVPQAIYDKPGNLILSGATNVINLTYGGATTGKLNPNGSALFPWVTNSSTYIRPQPLTAVFTDLRYNLDGTTNFLTNSLTSASTLASNVATFIATNGPLSMAGQISDIPAINGFGATVNPTRNDIVSQSVGLLETRSSVFSVWVAAQSTAKKPANTGYGSFETGDIVQAEKRYHFTVERYLDLGVDGVPGNANSPGPDNVVGTLDDTVDATYNPTNPKYKYRIINAQEIL